MAVTLSLTNLQKRVLVEFSIPYPAEAMTPEEKTAWAEGIERIRRCETEDEKRRRKISEREIWRAALGEQADGRKGKDGG